MTSLRYEAIASVFTVRDIAQPIKMIFAPEEPLISVWEEFMEHDNEKDWCGLVRDDHHTYGYLGWMDSCFEAPISGIAHEKAQPIGPEILVPASLPLLELVRLFGKSFFYFVLSRNEINHVVSFQDLDKLPFKFSLFSLFMELESQLIELLTIDDSKTEEYVNLLSEKRLSKAKDLCIKKYGENKETPKRLLLCTNFVDKKEMLLKSPDLKDKLPFESKRKANSFFSKVDRFRNQIAHSDSILDILGLPGELIRFIDDLSNLTTVITNMKSKP